MATLRIDDTVNEALKKAAAKKPGVSATKLANELLSQGLGLTPKAKPGPPRHGVRRAEPSDCPPHPAGRIIDGICMACGGKA